ncbi:hypothetical protein HZC00_04825 [Candidatus Kaiserbacteria bacterium]|nr:hypothetical protein [Candidatus Kaiserbacteria bacterium]
MNLKILPEHIHDLMGRGATALASLDTSELERLCDEARALPFHDVEVVTKTGVVQNFRSCDTLPEDGALRSLMQAAEVVIDDQLHRKYQVIQTPLRFNEGVVQVYREAAISQKYSISPHRDHKECINVIAVFVLEGEASFCVCKERSGADPEVISSRPGDLILMRGYGFLGLPRPFHFVDNVKQGTRISFGLRHLMKREVMSNRR